MKIFLTIQKFYEEKIDHIANALTAVSGTAELLLEESPDNEDYKIMVEGLKRAIKILNQMR